MEKIKRDSVVIYRNLFEALQEVPERAYKRVMNAVLKYAMDGEELELKGLEKSVFNLAKTQIDANNKKYENGKKGAEFGSLGGRPKKSEEKPQENPKITPDEPLNVKCKMLNDNIEESKKESKEENLNNNTTRVRESYDEIIEVFEFSPVVQRKLKTFIQHCLANKHVLINEELDGICAQLDLTYTTDEERLQALDDAIKFGYYGLRRTG